MAIGHTAQFDQRLTLLRARCNGALMCLGNSRDLCSSWYGVVAMFLGDAESLNEGIRIEPKVAGSTQLPTSAKQNCERPSG
jgi:hypothetical protein